MPLLERSPVTAGQAAMRANWFWRGFLPGWLARARDHRHGGFFDALDSAGQPNPAAPKTVLAQARLLFTFAHLARLSGDPAHRAAALAARDFLPHLRKAPGLYRRAVASDGRPTGDPQDEAARSYDQSFVILALTTWAACEPAQARDALAEAETCWQALLAHLTDPATGLLLEDDATADPAAPGAPPRAQNPHMHLYEAALQAFETTGARHWLDRAARIRDLALRHFLDPDTGTITEFLTPDLRPLPGDAGLRREVGHQCEWAWLLWREADLGGDASVRAIGDRLMGFALDHGFAPSGRMAGAAFDAVSAGGAVMERSFLLWPQTEAVKAHAARHLAGIAGADASARELQELIFAQWFDGHPVFVNQLDATGATIWPEALSRLLYHIVLALTEGARAGLWPGPAR
ncbi:AGE family epimerase/isomerase [Paracoccus siganidrum]|uniref:Mannose-6-phosphate isomerase n=1 Tax=Paracoccus siganidrum TaxID=1276757 RepID=A0A419AAG1_9RHOB|nr:AGE family epimerase/isomerase [Paracoccus siganidrum]RJL19936.1 hypothetical protein D3P05_04240 [Paracoccus siganidrum]RMC35107.1 hypothetical protein C9E82_10870 [Paracoccus siganidrum]